MKKIFLITIFIISSLLFSINSYSQTDVKYGDINGDGRISSSDYVLLDRYITKNIVLTEQQIKIADLNGDNIVSADDELLLINFIYGLITSFPVDNTLNKALYTPTKDQIEISLGEKTLSLKIKFPDVGYKIVNQGSLTIETNDNTIADYTEDTDSFGIPFKKQFKNLEKKITKTITIKDIKIERDISSDYTTNSKEENLNYTLDFTTPYFDVNVNLIINDSKMYTYNQWEEYTPTKFDIYNRYINETSYTFFDPLFPNYRYRILNYTKTFSPNCSYVETINFKIQKQNFGVLTLHSSMVKTPIDVLYPNGYDTFYKANDILLAIHYNFSYSAIFPSSTSKFPLKVDLDKINQTANFEINIPPNLRFLATQVAKFDLGDGYNTYACFLQTYSPYNRDHLDIYYPNEILVEYPIQNFKWSQKIPFSDKNRLLVNTYGQTHYMAEFDSNGNITKMVDTITKTIDLDPKFDISYQLYPTKDTISSVNQFSIFKY